MFPLNPHLIAFRSKRPRPLLNFHGFLKVLLPPESFLSLFFSRKSNQRSTFSTLVSSPRSVEESVNFPLCLDCQFQYSAWCYFIFLITVSQQSHIFIHAHDGCDFLDRVLCFVLELQCNYLPFIPLLSREITLQILIFLT